MWSTLLTSTTSKYWYCYLCVVLLLTSYMMTTAEAHEIQSNLIGLDWSPSSSSSGVMLSMIGAGGSSSSSDFDHDLDEIMLDDNDDEEEDESSSSSSSSSSSNSNGRRSLYWNNWKRRYYISYGALSANRVPCPPRSGRSYYTHNCFSARAPANPYHRGCSCISRCRR